MEIHRRVERLDRLAISNRPGRVIVIRPCPRWQAATRRLIAARELDRLSDPPDPPPAAPDEGRQSIGFVMV
jgi:hypothetical protein